MLAPALALSCFLFGAGADRPAGGGTVDALPPAGAEKLAGGQPGDVPAAGAAATSTTGPETFGFDLLPAETPTDPALALALQGDIDRRRTLLQLHTAFGFANVAVLAATVIAGQLNYTDRFGGGQSSGQYEGAHTLLEGAATAVFAGDALLALLAPVPIAKKGSQTALTIHEVAMAVAAAGFASEIPLGIYTVAREGRFDQGTFALIHLIVGYATAAAVATGVGVLAF